MRILMKMVPVIAVCAGGALLLGGCSMRARAAAPVPLDIPDPPPRVALDPMPAPVEDPAPEPPAQTPAPRPVPPSAAPPAATTAPPASAHPPLGPQPEPTRTSPAPELRPAGPAGGSPTAAQVRDRIIRTRQKLDGIDVRRLNAGRRTDYDSARRFLAQAESAARDNNLLLAESSVEKAETLADGLR